jgi:predicted DNA-binding protein (MmcQ/YjbR family)
MTLAEIEAFCLSFPGVTVTVQWGDDHVYKVGGKMFAVAGGRALGLSFKASEMAFELLPQEGIARPAPYLGRAKWLQITDIEGLSDDNLRSFLGQAYDIIRQKLPKRVRVALAPVPPAV